MLSIIGIGLSGPTDISVKGFERVKEADRVYLEVYTSVLECPQEDLEKFYGKSIIRADRAMVENNAEHTILHNAKDTKVVFLVIGDALSATTHVDLWQRASAAGIKVELIFNASVLTAVGATGLELYKFGKVTSIPKQNKDVETPYLILAQNQSINAHTLFLLDLDPINNVFLTIPEAIDFLLSIEQRKQQNLLSPETLAIGCARLGSSNQLIKTGTLSNLRSVDFEKPPFCLIIPAKLHFVEEELINQWK